MWIHLTAGAALHIPAEEARGSLTALRDWIADERLTTCYVPTPIADRLIAMPWPEHTALRLLHTGGDRLTRHPGPGLPFALHNHYGPTECAVISISGEVPPLEGATRPPSIGAPAAGFLAHLLDDRLLPVADGEEGELYLGGPGVGLGYLGRPALTAERFVADPFGDPGARLYRTGDLARRRADGSYDFLGRVDDQVKVRGNRVELGEIEALLGAHPRVASAAVLVRDDELLAYVVPSAATEPVGLADDLRDHLGARLPAYMVPGRFVLLETLPLTANGKVDRRALPEPERERRVVAPGRTPAERAVARVWADGFGVEVGPGDDFLALGGQSLLAMRLALRLEEELGKRVEPRLFLACPALEDLAAAIDALDPRPRKTRTTTVRQRGRRS